VQSITDDGPIDVTVCIANWNCRELLRACLESLHDQPQGVRVETVVVDNASTDGAADMVARDFPEVVLVRNAANAGFAKANNQAAARARGRYLFFLNNDTVVPAGALRRLVTFADAHPEVGMLGPKLRDPQGRLQISYRRRPTVGALLHRTLLFRWTGLLRGAYRRYRREDFDPSAQRRVDVLMGAAVLLPRDVFFGCGRWDEAFTFGGEDIDLSVRVNRRHAVVYLPHVEVTHHGRVSSRQNVTFAEPNVEIGYVRYLRKAGASWPALVGYKLAVTADAPLQWLAKCGQYAWRRLRGRRAKAKKSLLAARGLGHFLTRGLVNFWRA
jgi:GT2 family glycosyltransferase